MQIKIFAYAAMAALSLAAFGAPASATVNISNIGVLDGTMVHVTAPGVSENAFASPQLFTKAGDTDPSLLFFCLYIQGIDTLGNQSPPQAFNDGVLTTDYNGHALSDDQKGHVKDLLQQATNLYVVHDYLGLEAMQVSFWEFVDGATIDFLGNTALATRTTAFVNDLGRISGPVVTMDAAISTTQSGTGVPLGVPEPATWGLMTLGFAGLGTMLRRNRRQLALAT